MRKILYSTEMENPYLKFIGFWAMALILFVATFIIIRWSVDFATWASLSASDTGTWVGAIGTVGTLIGTIHLARMETRKREREQLDIALVSTTYLITWIGVIRQSIWVAQQKLPGDLHAHDDVRIAVAESVGSIIAAGIWTREDVTALAPLPNHVAARLAALAVALRTTLESLKTSAEDANLSAVGVIAIRVIITNTLQSYSDDLEKIRDDCYQFLAKHGVMPHGSEH